MADIKRGSDSLRTPVTFSPQALDSLLELRGRKSVRLVDWCVYGQPGPDGVCGSFQVEPKVAAELIDQLMNLDLRLRFEVFPLGIIAPDLFQIDFAGGLVRR